MHKAGITSVKASISPHNQGSWEWTSKYVALKYMRYWTVPFGLHRQHETSQNVRSSHPTRNNLDNTNYSTCDTQSRSWTCVCRELDDGTYLETTESSTKNFWENSASICKHDNLLSHAHTHALLTLTDVRIWVNFPCAISHMARSCLFWAVTVSVIPWATLDCLYMWHWNQARGYTYFSSKIEANCRG